MNCKMRFSVMLAMLATFVLTHAQEALPVLNLTLDKAIELALNDNPTMKVAEQEITLKEVAKKEAWQSLLPSVTLDGTIPFFNYQFTYMASVGDCCTDIGLYQSGIGYEICRRK